MRLASPFERPRIAFTLIELLVVIGIIAVLAAILFPVFAQARAKSRQTVCESNLRQIGLAIRMYQQDYDETYVPKYNCLTWNTQYADHCDSPALDSASYAIVPAVPQWLPAPDAPPGTEYLLKPYLKNDGVQVCPSRYQGPPNAFSGLPISGRYVLNSWDTLFGDGRLETSPQGQPDARVPDPAGTLIVWEHKNPAGECQVGQTGGTGDSLASAPDHWENAHQGGFNALWCDGHVKWLREDQLRRHYFTIQQD